MEVTFLGTGAPLHMSRATTGMIVKADGCEPLLIDTCGGNELTRSLDRAGVPLADIRNVIVTHRHADHAGGMMSLFLANMPLDVHALDDTYTGICEMKAGCFPEWDLHPEVRHHRIETGERREIGGLAVEFFRVEHRVPTIAIRIIHRGKTFAFSADSLPCEGLNAAALNADLFVCDAICAERDGEKPRTRARTLMHPTAKEAAEISKQAGVHRLACVHIGRFGSVKNILEEAQMTFGEQVEVPNDGDRCLI